MKRTAWLVALIGFVVLVGCGVVSQDSAEKTDPQQAPFGLLDRNRGAEVGGRSGDREAVVFLTKDDRLVRTIRSLAPPVTLDGLLESLKQGPTRTELRGRSALARCPTTTRSSRPCSAGGTALVDLGKPFTAPFNADQVLALAQIVFTLTARPGVGQVQFTLQDATIETPRARRVRDYGSGLADDYVTLAPSI